MAARDIVETARRLRREMTPPEARLWLALRGNRLGVKFRRQHPSAATSSTSTARS